MTPKEAARYVQSLLGFCGKATSELRFNVSKFVEQWVEAQVAKQFSDADLAKMVHDLNKCETEESRIDWYMAERKAMAYKKNTRGLQTEEEKDEKP